MDKQTDGQKTGSLYYAKQAQQKRTLANSVDLDQMHQNVASDNGSTLFASEIPTKHGNNDKRAMMALYHSPESC